jgi:hypothetical protein
VSDLINLTRTLSIEGFQFVTTVHVAEVAPDDESGPAVQIEQNWNPDYDDRPSEAEDDVVWLTWAEWAELRDHVETARHMMPEPLNDAAIKCGFQIGDLECGLDAGHPPLKAVGAWQSGHITSAGVVFDEEPPF